MIRSAFFYNLLIQQQVDFFTGVPDSLLKDICAYISDHTAGKDHIISANEGNAVAIAAGYHMATGKIPLVYMQNSGLGNTVNPLLSLTDQKVYSIPLLLMIGWRGEPGVKDEPQHIRQGEVMLDMLDAMKIGYTILSSKEDELSKQLQSAIEKTKQEQAPYAIIVKKGTFEKYSIKNKVVSDHDLSREEAIIQIVDCLRSNDIIVSTTGKTSRELFEYRARRKNSHHNDFLTVGSMGHASQIALGIALQKPERRIFCLDGDGALLMHLGGMSTVGNVEPENFVHIVINNGAHESVGGQPTAGFNVNIPEIALANNYRSAMSAENSVELQNILEDLAEIKCPALIEIKVKIGSRNDLGRPTIKPVDNKTEFMKNLE